MDILPGMKNMQKLFQPLVSSAQGNESGPGRGSIVTNFSAYSMSSQLQRGLAPTGGVNTPAVYRPERGVAQPKGLLGQAGSAPLRFNQQPAPQALVGKTSKAGVQAPPVYSPIHRSAVPPIQAKPSLTNPGRAAHIQRIPDPLGITARKLAPAVLQKRVVQRNVAQDLSRGDECLDRLNQYHNSVMTKLNNYKDEIQTLDTAPNSDFRGLAAQMARGYKTWAENYYNKSQAYLYEAQKVSEKTKPSKSKWASLGTDTTLLPDIEIFQYNSIANTWESKALELKTSTSEEEEAVSKLTLGALKQLKKRTTQVDSFGAKYSSTRAHIHSDNNMNTYPLTNPQLTKKYKGDLSQVTDWDGELKSRVGKEVKKRKFDSGLEPKIVLELEGKRFAKHEF